jgi:hypothetical protein
MWTVFFIAENGTSFSPNIFALCCSKAGAGKFFVILLVLHCTSLTMRSLTSWSTKCSRVSMCHAPSNDVDPQGRNLTLDGTHLTAASWRRMYPPTRMLQTERVYSHHSRYTRCSHYSRYSSYSCWSPPIYDVRSILVILASSSMPCAQACARQPRGCHCFFHATPRQSGPGKFFAPLSITWVLCHRDHCTPVLIQIHRPKFRESKFTHVTHRRHL